MQYTFHFGDVWAAREQLLLGALLTLRLSVESMALGLVIAVLGAFGRIAGPAWLRWIIATYVEVIRNTPFLVQLFMLYFGLPMAGLRLDSNQVALLAMTLSAGAYSIEIVRAGLQAVAHGQVEAAQVLGLGRVLTFRLILLPQGMRLVFPPLASQFILLMLGSSVVSAIAANDLTSVGQAVEAENFRSFEVFLTVGAIYYVLSLLLGFLFRRTYVVLFGEAR